MTVFAFVLGLLVTGLGASVISYHIGFERGGQDMRDHQEQMRLSRIANGRPHPPRPGSQPARVTELRMNRN